MQTESRSFNQVSVKIQRPKSLPTAWSMIVSTLFLTERALQMAKRRLLIMQNRNWFYFEFSVESPSLTFNNFKMEKFKLTFEG